MPPDKIIFSDNMYTGYLAIADRLYIGTDVYPSGNTTKANYMLSHRAGIAHEVVGHRQAYLAGKTQSEEWLEEVQASLRASKAKGLSDEDRELLKQDAVDRLPDGVTLDSIVGRLFLGVVE